MEDIKAANFKNVFKFESKDKFIPLSQSAFFHFDNKIKSEEIEEFGNNKIHKYEHEKKRKDSFPVIEEKKIDDENEKDVVIHANSGREEIINSFNIEELYNLLNTNNNLSKSIHEDIIDINHFQNFNEDTIKKSYSIIADDYLKIEDLKFDEEKLKIDFNDLLKEFDEKKDLHMLKKTIQNQDPIPINTFKIGPVSTLDFLVENSFNSDYSRKKSIIENILSFEDIVYRWRKVGGDGNCYYRAVIFAYVENIILQNNSTLLQYLILDLNKLFKDEICSKLLTKLGIKTDLILKILVTLYHSLIYDWENGVLNTYDLFVKSINNCKAFDLGLIFYFRFKLYEFIKSNEDKLYTRDFSVKIGNLLPAEYETDEGNFLYKKFYDDYLLKMYVDAEKIVIYLTPFVLKINLKVLVYDFGKNNVEKLKDFPCNLKNASEKPTIVLLYKKTHYDLIYEKKYFEKYINFLSFYVNLDENLRVVDKKLLEEINKIKKSNKEKIIIENKKKDNNAELLDLKIVPNIYNNNNLNNDLKIIFNIEEKLIVENNNVKGKNNENKIINKNEVPDLENLVNLKSKTTNYNKANENIVHQIFNNDNINVNNYNKTEPKIKMNHINLNFIQPKMKCSQCKKDFIPYQTIIKLCKECIISEIKTNIMTKYFTLLQSSKENFYQKMDPNISKTLFKCIFYDSKVKILDHSFSLLEAFNLIDYDFKDFLIKNVKNTICAVCENSLNPFASTLSCFILPCNCHLCSEKCLKEYFNIIFLTDPKKRLKDLNCFCSYNYDNNDIKNLLQFCHSKNMKTNKEKILEIYQERIFNQCMLCLNIIDMNNQNQGYLLCDIKDLEVEKILKIKEFNHLLCNSCFADTFVGEMNYNTKNKKYEINKPQLCMICSSIHCIMSCAIMTADQKLKSTNDCKFQ